MGAPRQPSCPWPCLATEHTRDGTTCDGADDVFKQEIIRADQLIFIVNPAILPDASNMTDAPAPKVDPYVCNKAYGDVQDLDQDLAEFVATCQRHTRYSASAPTTASRCAGLATSNLCSRRQPSSQRMSRLSTQLGMMG